MKDSFSIIDMRCRPPYKGFLYNGYPFGLYDTSDASLTAKFGLMTDFQYPLYLGNPRMALFLRDMDEAGVDYGVAPYRAAWGDPENNRGLIDNGDLLELMQEYPDRFIGVAGISPVYGGVDHAVEQIERFCVQGPMKGILMEPFFDRPNWFLNDAKLSYPLLEVCRAHHLPVLLTFGGFFGFPKEQLPPLVEALKAFPDVNFVLCHGGYPEAETVCHMAFMFNNLYISPDMYVIHTPASRVYIDAANYQLRDRICFGSACPGISMQTAVRHYMNCGIRKEVLGNILSGNAARLFNMTL